MSSGTPEIDRALDQIFASYSRAVEEILRCYQAGVNIEPMLMELIVHLETYAFRHGRNEETPSSS